MTGELFGPYRLEELIGRGGMGEVFRAYDTVRDRTVALKRLPPHLADDPDYQARFRHESRIAARLTEPHIIPIHDYGEIDGRLFIDMRLVTGSDLASVLERTGALPAPRAAHILTQIADALAAAHAQNLVHRDVKPSNVLITGLDSGADYAYLIDFGISRTSAATTLTATGVTIGTLAYLAPERFLGQPADHRADIYALGCLLYELLTGTRPFPGEAAELVYAHVNVPPPAPSRQHPGVPATLDAVVATAMAKAPARRYQSAEEFSAALAAALATPTSVTEPDRPEPAHPPQRVSPASATAFHPDEATDTAAAADDRPAATRLLSTRRSRRRLIVWSGVVAVAGCAAVAVVVGGVVVGGGAVGGGAGGRGESLASIRLPADPQAVALSSDGRHAYTANFAAKSVTVIDTATNTATANIPIHAHPVDLAVAPDGRHAYLTNSNTRTSSLTVIDTANNTVDATISVPRDPQGVAVSPDGARVYTANAGADSVAVIDTAGSRVVATVPVGRQPTDVVVAPDGRHAYVANYAGKSVSVLDTATNTVSATIPVEANPQAVAIAPDGALYAAAAGTDSITVLDPSTGTARRTITVRPGVVLAERPRSYNLALSPDGRRAYLSVTSATDTEPGRLAVIDTARGAVAATITVDSGPRGLAVSPDGRRIYLGFPGARTVSVLDAIRGERP